MEPAESAITLIATEGKGHNPAPLRQKRLNPKP